MKELEATTNHDVKAVEYLIGERLDTPILCNGFTLFGGGELLLG